MIRVSTSNWYVGNTQPGKDAKFLATYNCDVSGVQEGHSGNIAAIEAAIGDTHRIIYGRKPGLGPQDAPVIVPKTLRVIKSWSRQINPRAEKKNIGMDRNATVVRFHHEGEIYSLINTHTMAAVQGKDGNHYALTIRRVAYFVKGMIVLETMIRRAKKRGDKVIVTGDLNYRPTKAGIWFYSPQALFKRTGLLYTNLGIDYIAYDRSMKLDNLKIIPHSQTGSDHSWLVAELIDVHQ